MPLSLGRTKTGRHRPVELVEEIGEPDHELESYLAALAPDPETEVTLPGTRFGESEVYQLRMSLMANTQLRELAAQQGTSPQALAQEWVTERLTWEFDRAVAQ